MLKTTESMTGLRCFNRINVLRWFIAVGMVFAYTLCRLANRYYGLQLDFYRLVALIVDPMALGWMFLLAYRRVTSQAEIVDAGGYPTRFLLGGACLVVIVLLVWRDTGLHFSTVSQIITYIALFTLSLSRLKIRDNGLHVWGRFIPWQRIHSIDWTGRGQLYLSVKYRIAFLDAVFALDETISVPADKKDAFDAALRQHLESVGPSSRISGTY